MNYFVHIGVCLVGLIIFWRIWKKKRHRKRSKFDEVEILEPDLTIVHVSDTHGHNLRTDELPDGDLLFHTGRQRAFCKC